MPNPLPTIELTVTATRQLAPGTFEIRFRRPPGFTFLPGQRIRIWHRSLCRDYSLICGAEAPELAICVRRIPNGQLTPRLVETVAGDRWSIHGPLGYFTFQPSQRPTLLVATGTGIAPFVAYANSGLRGFFCLHGVRRPRELYYRETMSRAAQRYIPCLSQPTTDSLVPPSHFGRVTDLLGAWPAEQEVDFYLCGNGAMVRDALAIIDERFPSSRVYTEPYF
jgi:ferredoxin-NADP reductase